MSGPYHYASAADAYGANPTTQHTTTNNDFDYPVRASIDSPYTASQPAVGAGAGAYDARNTNSRGYAPAPGEDHDEEDDDDEDWNVYDDFNMTRPQPHRSSTSGFASQNDAYWDASKPSLVETPYSDIPGNRKSLLPSEAFGFDVRNADPRRSIIQQQANAAGNRNSQFSSAGYNNNTISGTGPRNADATTGIELITVPALGNEYTKEELRDMTRSSKRRKKRGNRKRKCQLWVSGDDHLWGWLSPRLAVFIAFFVLLGLGVMLFFVIPRVPTFATLSTNPVVALPNGASMRVNHSPTNFSMTMGFNLRASNRAAWIPTHATDLTLEVTDLNTYMKVGKGHLDSITFKAKGNTEFQFPVDFSYVSLNTSGDQTWQDFYQGCGPNYPGQTRPTLNLALRLGMSVQGLIGRKETNTQLGNIACPFTLQTFQ
ncbi:hypothetical protein PSEUBRA_000654 [Kalmanozyma brasiliensis GHG001]|uniref:Late embryogenesis abundant protein LEA-2 subgroup domain-containing protein n=1 Tax=Kalmanozyma brasiliensis (strain GHG001) TaxID=1365824 RepID=V5F245_KALBG|nr:uncharacterized protein PSEUBRA_000654 [Kalmanozyma brasiliensis GHG001]EST09444.1 hypothetical protein PSEUBRA_000654 [Kalmanozyma brasiliensis GHG001]